MTFKKISASLALLLASATITACGGNNDTTAECADGEIKAQIGEGAAQCYKTCTADDDCGDGESCTGGGSSKVCVGSSSTDDDMDTTPDDDMDTVTPDADMDTTMPDMDMDTVTPDADMDTTMPDMDMDNGNAPNTGEACADATACTGMMADCLTEVDAGFPEGYCSSVCSSDANCGADNVCFQTQQGGLCLSGCTSDANCRTGYTCQDQGGSQVCLPKPPDYIIGNECTAMDPMTGASTDCGDGFCVGEAQGFPGGYCLGECVGDQDCPTGAHCTTGLGEDGDLNVCTSSCTDSSECRTGYACGNLDDDARGECWPTNTDGAEPGAACAAMNLECQGFNGVCLADMNTSNLFPADGYCASFCEFDGGCPTGAHCTADLFNVDICLDDCAVDADCNPGYTCQDANGDSVNECMPQPVSADGPGLPGAACTDTATDCAGGTLGQCLDEDIDGNGTSNLPGGYCTVNCSMDSSVCVAGSHCVSTFPVGEGLVLTNSVCGADCTDDSECRTGYTCLDVDSDGSSECVVPPAVADGPGLPGDACTSLSDCAGGADGQCIPEDVDNDGVADFPGGYCTTDCSVNACAAGSSCQSIFADMGTPIPLCFSDCVGDGMTGTCRAGYLCAVVDGMNLAPAAQGQAGFCIPPLQ